jgi:lipopolysaccharide/colanic/teichoic acid biosynthesis glycosyltransferase
MVRMTTILRRRKAERAANLRFTNVEVAKPISSAEAMKNVVCRSSRWRGSQLLDGSLSAAALLMLSPVLLMIGAAILVETGPPLLFTQVRVGREGKPFRLRKFRTMRRNQTGPSITAHGDSRITRVGRFLRKFKLDELPQLWNVMLGEMSLVGPRPEVPEFVDRSQPLWRSVLHVRPGLTDPASIAYRNEEELLARASDPIRYYQETVLPAKLALNLEYLEKRSFWLDLKVMMQTAKCALFPRAFDINNIRVAAPNDSK